MPPGALYAARRIQLGEEADEHAPSLTSAGAEGKTVEMKFGVVSN